MIRELSAEGVRVPGGFATTAAAYRHFIRSGQLQQELHSILDGLDGHDIAQLQAAGAAARSLLLNAALPTDLEQAILQAYRQLNVAGASEAASVAVRSSATAEDLPDASFAGQQETYLNVQGEAALLAACRRCFASLFTDRAISYRQINGFDHFEVALSIGVQRMVRADRACSGVMFSIDTETGFRNAVLLTAAYGLGENVVQGAVNPDEYLIFKPTLEQGFAPILSQRLGSKAIRMIYGDHGSTRNVEVPAEDRTRYALSQEEALQLARWACGIERHYSERRGQPTPMDIEWAKDGISEVNSCRASVEASCRTTPGRSGFHSVALSDHHQRDETPACPHAAGALQPSTAARAAYGRCGSTAAATGCIRGAPIRSSLEAGTQHRQFGGVARRIGYAACLCRRRRSAAVAEISTTSRHHPPAPNGRTTI
jgi:phosphoenolpyruvate synthase